MIYGNTENMIEEWDDIKFRAWDSTRKKWVYFNLFEIINFNHESLTDDEWTFIQLEKVGRYTGLHDKHDREIYEGDIIEFIINQSKWSGVVCYSNRFAKFLVDCSANNGGIWDFGVVGVYEEVSNRMTNIEVIANVYEDSKL